MTQAQKLADLSQAYTAGALGFRNKFINGNFSRWERGNNIVITGAATYGPDRWVSAFAGANLTAFSGGGPQAGSPTAMAFNGVAGNTYGWSRQRVESMDACDLAEAGGIFSISLYATAARKFALEILYPGGTDNFSTETVIGVKAINHPGNGWSRYALAFGADSHFYDGISASVGYTDGVPAGQTVAIARAQLEVGSIETPFQRYPIWYESAAAMRFYEVNEFTFIPWRSDFYSPLPFKVRKRVIPQLQWYSPPTGAVGFVRDGDQNRDVPVTGNAWASKDGCAPIVGAPSFSQGSNTQAGVRASAEL